MQFAKKKERKAGRTNRIEFVVCRPKIKAALINEKRQKGKLSCGK